MDILDEVKKEAEEKGLKEGESETPEKTEEAGEEETAIKESPLTEAKEEKVPASFQKRIDELVYRAKSSEEKTTILEKELAELKKSNAKPLSEEEQKEEVARNYLRTLLREELEAREKEKTEEESRADRELNEEVLKVSSTYSDFNEKEVLSVMEEFGIENVETGYKAWKKMNQTVEEAKDKTKKDILSKPKAASGVKTSDDFSSKLSEDKISSTPLHELIEQAKREAGI